MIEFGMMAAGNPPYWAQRPGEEYVKKFHELQNSTRLLDNTENDSDPAPDKVTFEKDFETYVTNLYHPDPDRFTGDLKTDSYSTESVIAIGDKRYPTPSHTYGTEAKFERAGSNSIKVTEGAWSIDGSRRSRDWERSFTVELDTGIVHTADPFQDNWFQVPL